MLQFIYFGIGLVIDIVLIYLTTIYAHNEFALGFSFFSVLVFAIWGGCLIAGVQDCIKEQLKNLHDIGKHRAHKVSYAAEMEAYKTEMRIELTEKYQSFEKTLMEHVKDSKLLAAVLEQSGYASLLRAYNEKIKDSLSNINACDRQIANSIADMQVRQDDFITGYGMVIPKRLSYTEDKKEV